MGLLTDLSSEDSELPAHLYKHHKVLSVLFYVIGLVWFIALGDVNINHATYFSENALLPGLVQGEFLGESEALHYLRTMKEEAERYPSGVPYTWLLAQLTQLGLDAHSHEFTLYYDLHKKNFTGRNVYGVLRAVRGSSTESLVVSTPYRAPTSLHQGTAGSIALMLALARFFSEQVYWAKDIIFLITEHEQLGMQAWLEAYHQTTSGSGILKVQDLSVRAGPIQAAVNLEVEGEFVESIDVKIEGLNGQLPNLDLVNLVHRLCHRENVQHTFKNKKDHPNPESFSGFLHQLETLSQMIVTQATGVPTGNHGLFHRYGIASVTLEGKSSNGRSRRAADMLQVGRVLEGICRSLNNLLERFHQSFFFYLLPATNRYVSIGVYMPPFSFLAGSLLIVALALWHITNVKESERSKLPDLENSEKNEEIPVEFENSEKNEEIPVEFENSEIRERNKRTKSSKVEDDEQNSAEFADCEENEKMADSMDYSMKSCLSVFLSCASVGIFMRVFSEKIWALIFVPMDNFSPEDFVFWTHIVAAVALVLLPPVLVRFLDFGHVSWELVKCLIVLQLSVIVFSTSIINFSLALVVTLVYAPIAFISSPRGSRFKKLLKRFTIFLANPLLLLFAFVFFDTWVNFPHISAYKLAGKAVISTKRAIMHAVVDERIYGNWVYSFVVLFVVPVWTGLWLISWYPVFRSGKNALESGVKSSKEKAQ